MSEQISPVSQSFRQIHLDFHTNFNIPDVGRDFDPDEFARTMLGAHVTEVHAFAKCNWGMSYYDTKIGTPHPGLKKELTQAFVSSLHKVGIGCVLHYSVGWSEWAARNHQDWLQLSPSGAVKGVSSVFEYAYWRNICFNTPYMNIVHEQINEIFDLCEPDGIFFDIMLNEPDGCCCNQCVSDMLALGLNPADAGARASFSLSVAQREMKRLYDLVKARKADASVFFNGRQRLDSDPARSPRRELSYATHVQLESLGSWGYNLFPRLVKFYRTLGLPVVSMTARFARSWGDFGGYKPRAALEYECFRSLAEGCGICIGDHLHPRGVLDPLTYKLIGGVFAQVKEKEPWCVDASPVSDIALMQQNDPLYESGQSAVSVNEAAMQMLIEDHRQFEIVDWESDLRQYKLLILPDIVGIDPERKRIIDEFTAQGGKLLLTGKSGLWCDNWNGTQNGQAGGARGFAVDAGAEFFGESEYKMSYIRIEDGAIGNMDGADYISYEHGMNVRATAGRAVAKAVSPYYGSRWNFFDKDGQNPPDAESGYDAVIFNGSTIYISHLLFTLYKKYGNVAHKHLISNCIDMLLGRRAVEAALPTTAQINHMRQLALGRDVIHILHYPKERRADIDIVEDVIPIYNVALSVYSEKAPKSVYLAPSRAALEFAYEDGRIGFTVPEISGHEMVVIDYK